MTGTLTKENPISENIVSYARGDFTILVEHTNPDSAGYVVLEVLNLNGNWLNCGSLKQYNNVVMDPRLSYRLRAVACNGDILWQALVEALGG